MCDTSVEGEGDQVASSLLTHGTVCRFRWHGVWTAPSQLYVGCSNASPPAPPPAPSTACPAPTLTHQFVYRSAYLIRDVVDEMSLSGLRPDKFILHTGALPA